ncbi:MAG: hypothetical protein QXH53_06665 [Nitrososphaerales archaeon]
MRSILTAELFLKKLIKHYGKHTVYTDGALWYQEACKSLGLIIGFFMKIIKALSKELFNILKIKLRALMIIIPFRKRECSLEHIQKWLKAFILHKQNILN